MSQNKKPNITFFRPYDFLYETSHGAPTEIIADRANAILAERAQVVYGFSDHTGLGFTNIKEQTNSHQALLINVQKLEAYCTEHEPTSAHTIKSKSYGYSDIVVTSTCKNCGAELRAKWEAVNE